MSILTLWLPGWLHLQYLASSIGIRLPTVHRTNGPYSVQTGIRTHSQSTDTLSRAVRPVVNVGPVGSPRHASVVATIIIGSYARNEVDV
jgi:hypothetical protein